MCKCVICQFNAFGCRRHSKSLSAKPSMRFHVEKMISFVVMWRHFSANKWANGIARIVCDCVAVCEWVFMKWLHAVIRSNIARGNNNTRHFIALLRTTLYMPLKSYSFRWMNAWMAVRRYRSFILSFLAEPKNGGCKELMEIWGICWHSEISRRGWIL